MGSWGYRPRDNDEAMGIFGRIEDVASLFLLGMMRAAWQSDSDQKWSLLGVVEILLDSDFSISKGLTEEGISFCEDILMDSDQGDDYFERYSDPEAARQECLKLKKRLESLKPEAPFGLVRAMNRGEGPQPK